MVKNFKVLFLLSILLSCYTFAFSQKNPKERIIFSVSIPDPTSKTFNVEMVYYNEDNGDDIFKMPVWTPGYYQRMDYAKNVVDLKAFDEKRKELPVEVVDQNTWKVKGPEKMKIISYKVKGTRSFVASNFVDSTRAYILPAGTFMYPNDHLGLPSEVIVRPYKEWKNVVTGLDSSKTNQFVYSAPNFDILYDSPILTGNLEELEPFYVQNIPHRFVGYKLGDFDRKQLMNDLKKIVEESAAIIGHIPYKHYTFIAIGPGGGGIEHLNNTTVSFSGSGLNSREGRIRMLHFLAHEYFHHYNVKRIRPIELGPFDYEKGSRTKLLWVSEGLSVYYEYLVVRRAGISTDEEFFNAFRGNIRAYEDKPGRLYQTLEQASWETWSDGPFGRTGDEVNKTISYYDKGPVVGMLLDLAIRKATDNKRSLDDVMRFLYKEYYMGKKRGFTDAEFKKAAQEIAKDPLDEVFQYVSTTKDLDYNKYMSYAGMEVDTEFKTLPGARLGITTRNRNDSVFVNAVEYESPAWNAGIRSQAVILNLEGAGKDINQFLLAKSPGDKVHITFVQKGEKQEKDIVLDKKIERTFQFKQKNDISAQQQQVLALWLNGKKV